MVNECIDNEIKIFPIPGPSAISTAISISGFSDKFLFYGFFPEKKQLLASELEKLSKFENTLVFFVSPKKINKIIPEIKKILLEERLYFVEKLQKCMKNLLEKM